MKGHKKINKALTNFFFGGKIKNDLKHLIEISVLNIDCGGQIKLIKTQMQTNKNE